MRQSAQGQYTGMTLRDGMGRKMGGVSGWGTHVHPWLIMISADTHLEIGHRWSDQCHPDCLKYSYSSVPGLVCSHFLKSFLRTVAAYVMATVRSSYSSLPGGGFSTYKTAHRIWLRIFSIALEKELRGPWKD